jgi:ATP-dependent protease HslVU (ClpYQ) peptidase subunit
MCVRWAYWAFANLTAPFQTELAIDTNLVVTDTQVVVADTQVAVTDTRMAVADTRMAVTDAQKAIAGTHTVVADTHTMVADIHRSVLTGREGTTDENHPVGTNWRPSTQSAHHPLDR